MRSPSRPPSSLPAAPSPSSSRRPSIAFIIYGVITNASIPALFAAGVLPGVVVGLALALPAFLISRRHGWRGERWGTGREIRQAFREAFWGLLAPVVILGGIYGGIFTATEAAVVAVFYAAFVGLVIYRTVSLGDLWAVAVETAVGSAVVLLIVGFGGLYAWAGSTAGVLDRLTQRLLALSGDATVVLVVINLIVFLAGYLLDGISIFYIFLPIFLPIVTHFGWDPVWFGVMMTVNVAIGQVTPPVAVNLYVAANVARLKMETVASAVWPFVGAMLLALGIVMAWPGLALWLPHAFGLR